MGRDTIRPDMAFHQFQHGGGADRVRKVRISPGPNFGPKRASMARYWAGLNRITPAQKPHKTSLLGMSRDDTGSARSLNNYGKVLKTELRLVLTQPANGGDRGELPRNS
jgi:hypothetical protein